MQFNLQIFFISLILLTDPLKASQLTTAQLSTAPQATAQLDDLYIKLMPESLRQSNPAETKKSFSVHLKDTDQYFPEPETFTIENIKLTQGSHVISGQMTYASFVKKNYKMTVINNNHHLTILVKLYFRGASNQDLIDLKTKIQEAEDLWNANKPQFDFDYKFNFRVVSSANEADFSPLMLDSTDGPYDTFWSRDWPSHVIAHEIGHMLGLGDEYNTVTGNFDCLRESLMCTAYRGNHMLHHYYFILRRFFN